MQGRGISGISTAAMLIVAAFVVLAIVAVVLVYRRMIRPHHMRRATELRRSGEDFEQAPGDTGKPADRATDAAVKHI